MGKFHIWTIGCQMNEVRCAVLTDELEDLGLRAERLVRRGRPRGAVLLHGPAACRGQGPRPAPAPAADVKRRRPGLQVALAGCIGRRRRVAAADYPLVDFFVSPSRT